MNAGTSAFRRTAGQALVVLCLAAPVAITGQAAPAPPAPERGDFTQSNSVRDSGELPARPVLYALDLFLPGYGALRMGRPGMAAFFFASRVGSVALGYDAYVRMVEYRSAERAARVAAAVYGPGLRFPDPYSGGSFRSADEFQRLADRRAAILNAAGGAHLFLAGLSLVLTHSYYEDALDQSAPVFSIGLGAPDPDSSAGNFAPPLEFAVRLVF